MRQLIGSVIILILLFSPLITSQEEPTVDAILDSLESANDNLKSFSGKFYQEEKDEFGDIHITQGNAYFLSPGRLLFKRFLNDQVIEEMGKNLEYAWRIRHRVKTVDRFFVKEGADANEGLSVTSAEDLRNRYDLKLLGIETLENRPVYHLRGKAKEKLKIKEVEIWINIENPAPVVKVISYQRRNLVTTFFFVEIERNVEVDADLFLYKAPKKYTETIH